MGSNRTKLSQENIEGETTAVKISANDLLHYKLQAIMREHEFPTDQLMYLGYRDDDHWYLIGGKHEVSVTEIEGIEQIGDEESAGL